MKYFIRAKVPGLTSGKEGKNVITPSTLNLVVIGAKSGFTLYISSMRFSESVLWHVLSRWRGCLHSFNTSGQNRYKHTHFSHHKGITYIVPHDGYR